MNVLYEDNHLLVALKPQNIPSQADSSGDTDMLSMLKTYIKEKYAKPGNVYLGLVHRLDRPTGGVMVFARTSKAAARLHKQILAGTFEKKYAALVTGSIPAHDRLEHYLWKDRTNNIVRVVHKDHPGAKKACLEYTLLQTRQNISLADIRLFTGRSHQIRVQMSRIGAPLVGDVKYGGQENPSLCLFAYSLSFEHPITHKRMVFHAPLPQQEPWTLFNCKLF